MTLFFGVDEPDRPSPGCKIMAYLPGHALVPIAGRDDFHRQGGSAVNGTAIGIKSLHSILGNKSNIRIEDGVAGEPKINFTRNYTQ